MQSIGVVVIVKSDIKEGDYISYNYKMYAFTMFYKESAFFNRGVILAFLEKKEGEKITGDEILITVVDSHQKSYVLP